MSVNEIMREINSKLFENDDFFPNQFDLYDAIEIPIGETREFPGII